MDSQTQFFTNETQERQNYGLQTIYSSHVTAEQQQALEQYHMTPQFGFAGQIQSESTPYGNGVVAKKTPVCRVTFSNQLESIPQHSYICKQPETGKIEGDESQLLLCSETFSSPTPPSDDSGWAQTGTSIVWTHGGTHSLVNETALTSNHYNQSENGVCESYAPLKNVNSYSVIDINRDAEETFDNQVNSARPKDHLLKAALLGGIVSNSDNTYSIALEKDINSNFQAKCANSSPKLLGNDGDTCRRMSGTNGFDKNRMTGSLTGGNNDNLSHLSDGAGPQGQPQPQVTSAAEGMLMGRVGGTGGITLHDVGTRSIVAGTIGAGPQVTIGGIFRPPQSVGGDTARYSAGTSYTTSTGSSTTVGPFSPLYTSHGHGLSPYSAFYSSQYPGFSTGVMHGTLDPQFGSYSAVLQSMGTHAAQSQVPRSPYGSATGGAGAIAQYPMLSVAQTSSQGSGKSYLQQNSAILGSVHERDELNYRREQELEIQRRHSTTGVIKDEKIHHFSVPSGFTEPSRASLTSAMRESPSQKRELVAPGGVEFYKVPSGREGSLKHRILRPSDSTSSVSIGNPQHSAFTNTDEPSPKRTKFTISTPDSDREPNKPGLVGIADSGSSSSEQHHSGGSGSSTSTHLHYPQHFVKGSIIQLANGDLKRVEDLETDDFVNSADISSDLKIDSSTVVHIEENRTLGTAVLGFIVGEHKVQVTVEATVEHPFFVFGQGWSSCEPSWTLKRYGLDCHRLTVGDVCISLTHKEVTAHAAEISLQQKQQSKLEGNSIFNKQLKMESSPRDSPRQRNKSPGHSMQSPVSSSYINTQGQVVYRSESGQNEPSTPLKDEHSFVTPTTSQIPTNSQTQEQKMHHHSSAS